MNANNKPPAQDEPKQFMQRKGHILVVAYPLQGHAAPLIKLSHRIAEHGIQVTFVITEAVLAKMCSGTPGFEEANSPIKMVSVPDGLESDDDRKNERKLAASFHKVMPGYLQGMLRNGEGITGVIIDSPLAFLVDMSKKMGFKTAVYWCSTPGCMVLGLNIPKLLEDRVIDDNGAPLKQGKIHLLQDMPEMDPCELTWYFPNDLNIQKEMFQYIHRMLSWMLDADWIICNWFDELTPSAKSPMENILSVGPLLTRNGQSAGSFYSENHDCLTWLDNQSLVSVVYVAFGSTSRFSQEQLDELVIALELMNRPFLFVAWSGLTNGSSQTYSDGFQDRIGDRGMLVEWAPQEVVLSHPSIGCFVSHCGWSSILESISMGVPILCWPYFGDQKYARTCLCDAWKAGLRLTPNEMGIVSRDEIKSRIDELVSDSTIKENVLQLKEKAIRSIERGGSSSNNLEFLVQKMSH